MIKSCERIETNHLFFSGIGGAYRWSLGLITEAPASGPPSFLDTIVGLLDKGAAISLEGSSMCRGRKGNRTLV